MKICVPLVVLAILIPGFISCSGDDKKTEPLKGITCLPEALRSHVLAFYPLGQTLSDFSGNENHLTAVGTFTHAVDRDGNENCAIEFDNLPEAGSYLTMADPQFLNGLEEFSISLWYSPEDPTREGGIYERLISRGDDFDCDGNGAWSVGLYDCRRPVFSATSSLWDEQVTLYCETEITARTGVATHCCHLQSIDKGDDALLRRCPTRKHNRQQLPESDGRNRRSVSCSGIYRKTR
jgi:hypothetical protein